jgi:hypothetical protein
MFLGPILSGYFYDLAQARGAFYGGAVLVFIAFVVSLGLRKMVPAVL